MPEYVYVVRANWYEDSEFCGIYNAKEDARKALKAHIKKEKETYKKGYQSRWQGRDRVITQFLACDGKSWVDCGMFVIEKARMNEWRLESD